MQTELFLVILHEGAALSKKTREILQSSINQQIWQNLVFIVQKTGHQKFLYSQNQ